MNMIIIHSTYMSLIEVNLELLFVVCEDLDTLAE